MGLGCIAIPDVYYAKSSCADKGLYYLPGPFLTMVMQVIGHWRVHLIGAALTLCATIATAFASQYWHVIVSFAVVQGKAIIVILGPDVTYYNILIKL